MNPSVLDASRRALDTLDTGDTLAERHAHCSARRPTSYPFQEEIMADDTTRKSGAQNEIEGGLKETAGKVRGKFGDIIDDRSEHIEGKKQELKGKAQKNLGKAQGEVEELDETL